MLLRSLAATAIATAFGLDAPPARAQAMAAGDAASAPLPELTVTATRTERQVDDVPATLPLEQLYGIGLRCIEAENDGIAVLARPVTPTRLEEAADVQP